MISARQQVVVRVIVTLRKEVAVRVLLLEGGADRDEMGAGAGRGIRVNLTGIGNGIREMILDQEGDRTTHARGRGRDPGPGRMIRVDRIAGTAGIVDIVETAETGETVGIVQEVTMRIGEVGGFIPGRMSQKTVLAGGTTAGVSAAAEAGICAVRVATQSRGMAGTVTTAIAIVMTEMSGMSDRMNDMTARAPHDDLTAGRNVRMAETVEVVGAVEMTSRTATMVTDDRTNAMRHIATRTNGTGGIIGMTTIAPVGTETIANGVDRDRIPARQCGMAADIMTVAAAGEGTRDRARATGRGTMMTGAIRIMTIVLAHQNTSDAVSPLDFVMKKLRIRGPARVIDPEHALPHLCLAPVPLLLLAWPRPRVPLENVPDR